MYTKGVDTRRSNAATPTLVKWQFSQVSWDDFDFNLDFNLNFLIAIAHFLK